METLFLQLCRMSLSAGWMILAVMLARPFLKKAPRALVCLLWGLAALRLLVPVTLKSRVSLVPTQTALPDGLRWTAPVVGTAPVQAAEAAPLSPAPVLAWIWAVGAVLMAGYALFSYFRLYRRIQVSLRVKDNIYLCDSIPSPFILGVFRPKIYIPSALTEEQTRFVLAHEQAHLHRGDHLWKPLGYLLLSVYWFNPLCWAAYILFCRDMEVACDERVVKPMEKAARSAYSSTLLECSVRGSMISACPLAFGEVGVKNRIRSVLNYRKPAAWVVAISCILCAVLACCFLTDPVQAEKEPSAPSGAAAVLAVDTVLRETPGGEAKAELSTGTWITVLGGQTLPNNETWAEIYCPEKNATGWIEDAMVAFTSSAGPMIYIEDEAVTLFAAPNASSRSVGSLKTHEEFIIERQAAWGSASAVWVWGTCRDQNISGWLMLPRTTPSEAEAAVAAMAVTTVNVRTAPDLRSPAIGTLHLGDIANILRWETVDDITWCYVNYQNGNSYGWVVCAYLKQLDSWEITPAEDVFTPVIHYDSHATVISTAPVYGSPSRISPVAATLEAGTAVNIELSQTVGESGWCLVSDSSRILGWVEAENLSAVQEFSDYDLAIYQGTAVDAAEETAVVLDLVELLSAPSDQARAMAALGVGKTVTIHQREIVADTVWCYISCENKMGWVRSDALQYQELPATFDGESTSGQGSGILREETTVLSSPSHQARTISTLASGSTVTILRREIVANIEWCYVKSLNGMVMGWVEAGSLSDAETGSVYEATVFPEAAAAADSTPAKLTAETDVHTAPSSQSRTVDTLLPGTAVNVLRREKIGPVEWCYIECEDSQILGWVDASSLTA